MMKRKLWIIIFQICIAIAAGILIGLSFLENTDWVKLAKTGVSAFFIGALMSASFPILFLMIAELFPTEIRGFSNAVILFFGKIAAASAPFLSKLSKDYGFHILVGCSSIVLVTIPLNFFLPETMGTLELEGSNKIVDESLNEKSGEDYHKVSDNSSIKTGGDSESGSGIKK